MGGYINVTKMSITLDNHIANELNSVSKELNQKKSHLIQEALSLYFDMIDEKVSDKRLRDLQNGVTKTIPASEVWAELGL